MSRNLNKNYTVSDDPQYSSLKLALTGGNEASQLVQSGLVARSKPSVLADKLFIEHTPMVVSTSPYALDSGPLRLTYNSSTAFELRWSSFHTNSTDNSRAPSAGILYVQSSHALVTRTLSELGSNPARLQDVQAGLVPTDFPEGSVPAAVYVSEDTHWVYKDRKADLKFSLLVGSQTVLSTDPAHPVSGGAHKAVPDAPFKTVTVREPFVAANGDITKGEKEFWYAHVGDIAARAFTLSGGQSVTLNLDSGVPWQADGLTLAVYKEADLSGVKLDGVPTGDTLDSVTVRFLPQALLGYPGTSYSAATLTVTLSLGQFVQRVSGLSVQGTNLQGVKYKVLNQTGWLDPATGTDLPVREAATGQLYTHTLQLQVPFSTPGQVFTGFTVNLTEEERFTQYQPPEFNMAGLPPIGWKAMGKRYRAVTDSAVTARHPDMPIGMGGLVSYDLNTGQQVYPQRYGDYLLFDGVGPWVAYWNPTADGPSLSQTSVQTFRLFQSRLARPGGWTAQEAYQLSRNVVHPRYTVTVAGLDMSEHLTEFSQGSVTLAGPANVFEALPHSVSTVNIKSGTQDVFTGRMVRADSRPYANGRVITFALLSNTQFFDVDMSKVRLEDLPIPAFEDEYVQTMLNHSGYQGSLRMAPGIQWRNVAFWQAASPAGPGMVMDEIEGRYWNTQNGTTLATLQGVMQANLLDLYDLPSGDVLVDRILPVPEKNLIQVLNTEAQLYCVADGKYVNDPRLNISGVSLALDEGFAETEVEGFSNEINLGIGPRDAHFVQNGVQNNFLDKSFGGYQSNSNEAGWNTQQPWAFEALSNGALLAEFIPAEWFEQAGITGSDDAVTVERTEQSGGFLGSGSKNITWKRLEYMSGEQAAVKWPARRADIQAFVDTFLPTLDKAGTKYDTPQKRMTNSKLAVGISAYGEGDWVSKATFRFRTRVAAPDESRLKVEPLVGVFNPAWAPEWLPPDYVSFQIQGLKNLKPRAARRLNNQFIARIGSAYAVQVPNYPDKRITPSMYDTDWTTSASQLASFLTIRDLLKTRSVEVSFAGAQGYSPNQFLAIARRPAQGPGHPVTRYDVLMTQEPGRPDARVGSEAWVRVKCAFVGTVDLESGECHYDMPLGWGASWEV